MSNDWGNIRLNQLLHPWKYCWKHNSYRTLDGSCVSCLLDQRAKENKKPIFRNPTPRKCRGHKESFIIENEKCSKCGGKA